MSPISLRVTVPNAETPNMVPYFSAGEGYGALAVVVE
jgi:hypothetical protein